MELLLCPTILIISIAITIITAIIIAKYIRNKNNQIKYSQYQDKHKKWQKTGYDLGELNNSLKKTNNINEAINLFSEFEEKIQKILELENIINNSYYDFSDDEKQELSYLLKQPAKIKEIEDFLKKKENIVREQREEIKTLSDKVRESAKELLNKTIDIRDMDLTEVISVLLNNLEKSIGSYQLGDSTFEKTKSELNKMLENIKKLSKTSKESTSQSASNKTTSKNETLYDILRVKPDANLEEIKYMRNALVKIFVNKDEELKQINNAYDILKDPLKRKGYNDMNNI